MKLAVLTSSRADFGIYLPLLLKIKNDSRFNLEIIAFGTHLSKYHGYTIDQIKLHEFKKIHEISTLLTNDNEEAISTAYGLTVLKFADFWAKNTYDWVLCLGDRFEMAAAVQAGIPFGVKFAHLHGGETTLGAIDNIYRHQITLASRMHFPATDSFSERISAIINSNDKVYTVGSLSIEAVKELPIPQEDEFRRQYGITQPFVLLTFHPETVSPEKNNVLAGEMKDALNKICKDSYLVITMPNADTFGTIFRKALIELKENNPDRIMLIENFGKLNYFAAMTYCKYLIGNTSSGIIEAASFGKYVVNVGDRQKGRAQSANIFDVEFESSKIIQAASLAERKDKYNGNNIYYREGSANLIIKHLTS